MAFDHLQPLEIRESQDIALMRQFAERQFLRRSLGEQFHRSVLDSMNWSFRICAKR